MANISSVVPSFSQAIFILFAFFTLKLLYRWYKSFSSCSEKFPTLLVQKWKKDVVYLYQFPRPSFLPNMSPFCLKVEAFLRLHDIKYKVIPTFTTRSSKGLVPFIELNGKQVADSQFILLHLKNVFSIEDNLTKEQKALERAFEKMIENSYFYGANWLKVKDNLSDFAAVIIEQVLGKSFVFLSPLTVPYFRKLFYTRFMTEGTAKHSDKEVLTILRSDLQAIEKFLDDKEFFFGDTISLIDILIFAHISAVYYLPWHHLASDLIASEFQKILKHVKKMEKLIFIDHFPEGFKKTF